MKFKMQYSRNCNFKTLLFTLTCALSFNFFHAQTNTIKGVVTSDGQPIPGVSIIVRGTGNGAITDFDGKYQINAALDSKKVLVFSYVGYESKEVPINKETTINVSLSLSTSGLEEVVVLGYGSAKRKDLTGSVVSIKAEELNKIKPISFEGGIAGRAAGVQIVTSEGGPEAGFKVRIRGGTSINASSEPLYVIDGFALPGAQQSTGTGLGNSSTSPLATIDPNTIASIEVLKDASATAIYGSRGANGVVMITTKSGKNGRSTLNFETFTSIGVLAKKIDLLSDQEFVDWRNEYTPWDVNNQQEPLVSAYRDDFGNDIDINDPRVISTDWQDEIARTAITNNYNLSMSGGSDKNSYAASFSYLKSEGIIKTTDFERYNTSLRVNQNITQKLKAGINLNMGFTKSSGIVTAASTNAGRSGLVTNAILFSPVQGLTQYNDAEYDEDGRILSLRDGDITNPNRLLEGNKNRSIRFNTFGNVFLEYQITNGLTFRTSVRGSIGANKRQAFFSEKFGFARPIGGLAFTTNTNNLGLTTEQNLTYRKAFGKHSFNVTAVYEQQQTSFESIRSESSGFDLPGVNLNNLESAKVTELTQSDFSDNSLQSVLGRVQYDFDDRFVLNVSARYDGSSRFAKGSKWGLFPSAGFAWKMSNEDFLKSSNTISDLRLKVSYGETGNTAIGSYISLPRTDTASQVLNGNELNVGVAVANLVAELTWETTAQFDGGISLGLFQNRISIDADYYNKQTTNLLLEQPIPATTGFDIVFTNIGTLVNKGFEFVVNTTNIKSKNFSWDSSFNISFNENEVTSLGGAEDFLFTAIGGNNNITGDYIIKVGEPLGNIFGIETDGLYRFSDFVDFEGLSDAEASQKMIRDASEQNVPFYQLNYQLKEGVVTTATRSDTSLYRPGLPKLKDQLTVDTNGDGIPDSGDGVVNSDDRTIIGSTVPKHFGGFTNNFTYKNFDLSILTTWSYGNDVYNKNRFRGTNQEIPFFNKFSIIKDRWTPENTDTDVATIRGFGDSGLSGNAYSDFIEDGSFLRLSNITIGYELPKKLIDSLGVRSFRLYAAADNIWIWSNYSGYDPEVNVGNEQLTPGLDSDSYPRARTFRIGLNVGF